MKLLSLVMLGGLFFGISVPLISETGISAPGKSSLNIEYARVGEKPLLLDLYQPKNSTNELLPCVIWVHGGGWFSGSKEGPAVLPLVGRGFVVASINYRLTKEAPFPAQIHDCKAAVRWIRKNAATYQIDPQRIAVAGFSAGGHLAALLGTSGDVPELEGSEGPLGVSSKVQAVVDGFGPSDFPSMWQEISKHPTLSIPGKLNNVEALQALFKSNSESERKALAIAASPLNYVKEGLPSFYIFHGMEDKTVPVSQSQKLAEALKSKGNDVLIDLIPGQGHGVQGPEAARRITDFLEKRLQKSALPTMPISSTESPASVLPSSTTSPVEVPVLSAPLSLSKKPFGVYALCPPDKVGEATMEPAKAKVWGSPGLEGIALRTFWDKLERTENNRDWSYFDAGVQAARQKNKSVSLSIASGIFTPNWAFESGVGKFQITAKSNYGLSKTRDVPLPWDSLYLEKWGRLVREMGERYDREPTVSYVVIGGAGMVVETYFAKEAGDFERLNKVGGSAAWLEGAKKVVDLFIKAFPTTPVILAMGEPVPGPEGKQRLEELVNYGLKTYPGHFGLMHHGLTAVSGREYYPNAAIANNSATTTVGFQMVWSTQGPGAQMIHGSLETALQHGVDLKAQFIEVYAEDFLSNRYGPLFEKTNQQLRANERH